MGLSPFSSPSSASDPDAVNEEELKVEGSMEECGLVARGGALNKKLIGADGSFQRLDWIDIANDEKGTSIVSTATPRVLISAAPKKLEAGHFSSVLLAPRSVRSLCWFRAVRISVDWLCLVPR